jgi:N-acetyl-beta-hexosaminidase
MKCIVIGYFYSTEELRRMFSKRAADIIAAKGLKLASWDDGIYADNIPNPITDYTS